MLGQSALALLGDEPEMPLHGGDVEADLRVVGRNRLAEKIVSGLEHPGKDVYWISEVANVVYRLP